MAQINSIQRQRILHLWVKDVESNGVLDKAEREELTALQQKAGLAPDAPLSLVRRWALGQLGATLPNSLQRSMSGREAQLQTLACRWPAPRRTTQQRIVELWEQRILWDMTPKQQELWRLRQSWT
jgi:hypothetical protein